MHALPPLAPGFIRLSVHLRRDRTLTPGEIARATGLSAENVGHIVVRGTEAIVDVRPDAGRQARENLAKLGPTQLLERRWQWLRLAIGRNHGLSMGQLKRILQGADALPAGRININNTHTLVGLQDHKVASVIDHLAAVRINGYPARPTALPHGTGPGSAAYIPQAR
jgi:hypothetical protein